MPNAIVFGGTSGLGLELAELLRSTHKVEITGRANPNLEDVDFEHLELNQNPRELWNDIHHIVDLPREIDLCIYSAGFRQEESIRDLDGGNIAEMTNVGINAPAMAISLILRHQERLPGFIAISSTSQWIPRPNMPMYATTKCGLGMFARSIAGDPKIGKVLTVGIAGMKTPFWFGSATDTKGFLEPKWVAEGILKSYQDPFRHRLLKALRNPDHFEVDESQEVK